MNLRTAATGFVAFLLSVPALQGDPYWAVTYPSSNICALRGSTVEIRCNYKYPYANTVEKKLWFTNKHNEPVDLRDDTDYTGRVEYSCFRHSCTWSSCTGTCKLIIKYLRQSDSAEYKFRITTNHGGALSGLPGVKLSVTDHWMEVIILPRPTSQNWLELECHRMCHLTGYRTYRTYSNWYRNEIQQRHPVISYRFYINSEYRVSCAATGFKHLPSPSVYAPETPSVGGTPPGVIKEGSSVNLTCTSEANPVAKYTWSKVTTGHPPGHSVQGQQLSFHPIQSSDSGQYLCTAENDLGTKSSPISIDVKYAPKTPSVSVRPPGGIKEGGSVTLSCSSDANPAANYTWFRDNQPLPWEPRRPYTLDPVCSKDRGTYHCQAGNQYGYLGSNSVFIDVLYAPKTPSVSVRPPGEIKEGSSVTLSCSSDANPAADYTWFREHGGSVEELGENYTISNITTELGGNYYCEAHNAVGLQNSTLMFLNVTATPSSPSSGPTTVAAGTVAVLLATMLLVIFLWMRRKKASRKAPGQGGRPDTRQESPPCPVYDNVSALTNRSASAARREPIEEQDDPHYPSIHFSRSKNQEVPRGFAGALVKSDHTEQVLYSAINLKRPKAVPE
ncbi:myelin-associated glycoprotein-like [Gadus chalcogrammus]|uniref:myelin-associated glycoprotein-like n=1 Tax=Gadus chalcogrammus TaxID=1042646 RepID=UPI0024C4E22C|nr:myelin-associated glycoprotein-like [Gadus chalcogrammus]